MTASSLISIVAAAVALIAAVVALRAARVARHPPAAPTVAAASPPGASGPATEGAAVSTPPSELPNSAPLILRVVDGHTRRDLADDTRNYVFVLDLTNRGTATISIAEIILCVTYRTRANFLGAVDLHADLKPSLAPNETARVTLALSTSNVIPRHCRIDAYTLLITTTAGVRVLADASLPAMLKADTDGAGPQTWGWD